LIQKIAVIFTDGAIAVTDANQDGVTDSAALIRKRKGKEIENFKRECDELQRVPNINIYTVGYELESAATRNALKSCLAGDGRHFDLNVGNVDSVFNQILSDLEAIRITN